MSTTEDTTAPATSYPESEKLSVPETDTVRDFLAFLEERGRFVAEYCSDSNSPLVGKVYGHEALLHEFLGIDSAALEAERRAMLRSLGG